jgi:methylated-DNA-[protein]-cysteine S-methyltransferase
MHFLPQLEVSYIIDTLMSEIINVQGPSVKVQFHIEGHQIKEIYLHKSPKAFQLEIIGACDKALRNLILEWMNLYAMKREPGFSLPLDLSTLPPFTARILQALQQIPFGKTTSYQQLAVLSGNPSAARAVGNACGRNPYPLVIPCHRVLRSGNQGLGGFSQGLPIKIALLEHEKSNFESTSV